jgi:hypothetical protein
VIVGGESLSRCVTDGMKACLLIVVVESVSRCIRDGGSSVFPVSIDCRFRGFGMSALVGKLLGWTRGRSGK